MIIRRRVIYRGRVQGVGFRATCQSIASQHQVGGSVRNLADGSVELVIEAEPGAVEAVLNEVAARMQSYIRSSTAEEEAVRGERDFRITR